MAVVRQVVVPLLDAVTGKGIKRVTVAASFLALVGTGFLELGDAHASWNDLWCVAQAVGFGVAFTRIEVGAVFCFRGRHVPLLSPSRCLSLPVWRPTE